MSRLIEGQDWSYQELFEEAWEKRSKEATGNFMDEEWDGGWNNMRSEAEEISKQIKKKFWGLESNAMYGIHYDDVSDILFSIHTVLRHQLWIDGGRKGFGVDSDEPFKIGSEPLAAIEKLKKSSSAIKGLASQSRGAD